MMARHLKNSCAQELVDPHWAAAASYKIATLKQEEESFEANQRKGWKAATAGTVEVAD